MIVIVNRFLFQNKFLGMTLWPFIFLKQKELKQDLAFMNHERIHMRQQIELLIVPFFIWYGIEFLTRWIRHKNSYKAYQSISFEQEAYINQKDLEYLNTRPLWNFKKYVL